jgi:hypothetical protein
MGNRTRDLPACSIVPQPTTLPRSLRREYRLCLRRNAIGEYLGPMREEVKEAEGITASRSGCFLPRKIDAGNY